MAMKYTTHGPLKPVGNPDAGFFVDGDGLLCTSDGRFVRDIFSKRADVARAGICATPSRGGMVVSEHVPERERLDDGDPQPERRGRPYVAASTGGCLRCRNVLGAPEDGERYCAPCDSVYRCSGCNEHTWDETKLLCLACEVREHGQSMTIAGAAVCSGCGRPLLTKMGTPTPCCCGADNPTNPADVQPPGDVDRLSCEEMSDWLAWLEAQGDSRAAGQARIALRTGMSQDIVRAMTDPGPAVQQGGGVMATTKTMRGPVVPPCTEYAAGVAAERARAEGAMGALAGRLAALADESYAKGNEYGKRTGDLHRHRAQGVKMAQGEIADLGSDVVPEGAA